MYKVRKHSELFEEKNTKGIFWDGYFSGPISVNIFL